MSVLTTIEPNAIEQGYLDQGYQLPEGWTWERVAKLRKAWDVSPIQVPIASDVGAKLGIVAWGVPFIDGKPLTHPGDEDATLQKKGK